MLDVEMHAAGVGLLQEQHPKGEKRGEGDAHGGAGLDAAEAFDRLDHQCGDGGGCGGAEHHRPGGDHSGDQEGDDDARQHHMADRVADQRLATQHQKISRHRAGDRSEGADQHRR